jgi:hypothetical protein
MAANPADIDNRAFYALLGVAPGASDDEIKRAYRQLATTLHPDKVADAQRHQEAAALFARIQEAYEVRNGFDESVHVVAEGPVHQAVVRRPVEPHAAFRLPPAQTAVETCRLALAAQVSRFTSVLQVLSDPQKRDIYDIYGLEGLHAGLEVWPAAVRLPRSVQHRPAVLPYAG